MIYLLLLLGMVCGFLLRKKKKIIRLADVSSIYVIYILLFFMGFSVGMNEKVVRALPKLGLQAGFISIFAIIGSILLIKIISRLIFSKHEK